MRQESLHPIMRRDRHALSLEEGSALVGDVQGGGVEEEGRPGALQEVAAADLHGCAVQLQQAPQEGLLQHAINNLFIISGL